MGTLHCTLENGADLYVNEHQKIQHYQARSAEERRRRRRKKNVKLRFFYFARCVRKIALYSDVIHSFNWKSAIEHHGVLKHDSVPSARYSSVCNVLRQWSISLILIHKLIRTLQVNINQY